MQLQSLRVQNFRCFTDCTVSFDPRLTVLVGANGSGKTAVLDALAPGLEHLAIRLIGVQTTPAYYKIFTKKDIMLGAKKNEINITIVTQHEGQTYDHTAPLILQPSNFMGANIYFDYQLTKAKPDGETLFVYYSAKRIVQGTTHKKNSAKDTLVSAFENCTNANIDLAASLAWFDAQNVAQLSERELRDDKTYTIPEFEAVRTAIAQALGKYKNARMDYRSVPAELVVYEEDDPQTPYKISQLSDGYRTMLALIMDLARRMAVANAAAFIPKGKDVLASPAIVLIDEIELHLHPRWQQTVLPTLMRIFPNTQFIVTTHSPQILSSIAPQHIRILQGDTAPRVDTSTLGAQSSRLLEDVFGVRARPAETQQKLDEYFRLLNTDAFDSATAKQQRKELDEVLWDDPALVQADMMIERAQRRRARANA